MTFLSPLFLLGLLGSAVPLVIHLLSRRTARRVEFSTLEFIRKVEKRSLRRLRIRQLLLLLLRMLLVAAVAIAMARPTLTGVAAGDGRGATGAALVLDASFSMRAAVGADSLLTVAKARALEILGTLDDGDEVTLLVPGAAQPEPVRAGHDLALVRERIAAVTAGERGAALCAVVRRAATLLAGSRLANREIHVISDFQRGSWEELSDVLPPDVRLFLVPVGEQEPANAWIESVDFSGQILATGAPVGLHTIVAAGGGFEPLAVEVELEVDGRVTDRRRLDLGPGARIALTFHETFGRDGVHTGAVTLRGAGGLAADDRRFFSLRTERGVPVLLVSGDERAGRYLRAALAPDTTVPGTFAVHGGTLADLATIERETAAVVILADVERLDDAALAGLRTYLASGGGVLLFPGPRMDAAAWGRTFLPRLLPGTLSDLRTVRPEAAFRIETLDPSHPLFTVFGEERGGLAEVRFTRALRFRAQAGTAVLARYEDGAPAIVESTLLPGRILFFTSALDPAWSDWPLTGVFLPVVHEAVRYLSAGGDRAARSLEVGDGATVRLATLPEGGALALVPPDGRERALVPVASPGGYDAVLAEADRPGLWVFRAGEGDTLAAFAANVPAAESDPARIEPAAVREALGRPEARVLGEGRELARAVREVRLGREIGGLFLWAAALLLLAEMIVAGRLGRARPGSAPA